MFAHIKAGNLVAIAVTSKARSRSLPETPTVAESGFPGFEAGSWFGFFAPRGTPQAVIAALNKAVNDVIAEKAVESRMVEEGADPVGGPPEKFGSFVRSEYENGARWCANWRRVGDLAGDRVSQRGRRTRPRAPGRRPQIPEHGLECRYSR